MNPTERGCSCGRALASVFFMVAAAFHDESNCLAGMTLRNVGLSRWTTSRCFSTASHEVSVGPTPGRLSRTMTYCSSTDTSLPSGRPDWNPPSMINGKLFASKTARPILRHSVQSHFEPQTGRQAEKFDWAKILKSALQKSTSLGATAFSSLA